MDSGLLGGIGMFISSGGAIRHLRWDLWFDRMETGALRRKRVSAEREKQFSLKYRKIYQERGPTALVIAMKTESDLTLSDAWDKVKLAFNGK